MFWGPSCALFLLLLVTVEAFLVRQFSLENTFFLEDMFNIKLQLEMLSQSAISQANSEQIPVLHLGQAAKMT